MIVFVLRLGVLIAVVMAARAAWAHPPPPDDIGGVGNAPPSRPSPPSPPPPPPPGLTCSMCVDAETMLDGLGDDGAVLRAAVPRFSTLGGLGVVGVTITQQQQTAIDAFELSAAEQTALQRLAVISGEHGFELLGAIVCGNDQTPCWQSVAGSLLCRIQNRCAVAIADEMVREQDYPHPCDPYVKHIPQPKTGFGMEWSNGGQTSAYPAEGRTWGYGFEAHRRFSGRLGIVGRIDNTLGRDAGRDRNGDGRDDVATGPIHRWWFLAGPSLTLTRAHYDDVVRWTTLELLGGYVATTSQGGDDGWVAGADLSFHLAVARLGVRGLHGFGGAKDVNALLVHVGFITGSGPSFQYGTGCNYVHDDDDASTRWAIGLDIPLSGYNVGGGPGYMAPGFGVQGAYHLRPHADALVRGDVLTYPNGDADRVLHQTLLAGGRFDVMSENPSRSERNGLFVSLLAGYAFGGYTHPSNAGSGPVVDAAVGMGIMGDDAAAWLAVHGRFGVTPEMSDLRAIFLSLGLELHVDRRRWRDDP